MPGGGTPPGIRPSGPQSGPSCALRYMFLGIEAIDEEGLRLHRKRVHVDQNLRALEIPRDLGLVGAVNIIADPDWDERRFAAVREWPLSAPAIVHMAVH